MFRRLAGEEDDSSQVAKDYTLGYSTRYPGDLTVGEEGTYMLMPSLENRHFRLNGNLAMVLS
jgi:hypothetical protein